MLKMISLSAVFGLIALTTAAPVVSLGSGPMAETRAMLLTATAFFVLASAVRRRWKGPPRRGPTRSA